MKACPRLYRVAMAALAGLSLMALTKRPSPEEPTPPPAPTTDADEVIVPAQAATSAAHLEPARPPVLRARSRLPVSHDVEQLAALKRAGVEPSVMRAYIEHSPTVAPADAAEIIYLHENGVPSEVMTAFIQCGSMRRAASAPTAQASQPPATLTAPPASWNATSPTQPLVLPAPAVPVPTYVSYPVYVYRTEPIVTYVRPTFYRPFSFYSYPCGRRVAPVSRFGCSPRQFSGGFYWGPNFGSRYTVGLVAHQPRAGIHFPHR